MGSINSSKGSAFTFNAKQQIKEMQKLSRVEHMRLFKLRAEEAKKAEAEAKRKYD
jgi:hypothetical protein